MGQWVKAGLQQVWRGVHPYPSGIILVESKPPWTYSQTPTSMPIIFSPSSPPTYTLWLNATRPVLEDVSLKTKLRIFTDITTYDWRAAMAWHCLPLVTFKSDKPLLDICDSCITQDQCVLRHIKQVVSSTITATSLIEFNFFSHHFNNNVNQNTLLAVLFVSLCCFQQEKTQASNISLYLRIFYWVLWMKFYPKNITQSF